MTSARALAFVFAFLLIVSTAGCAAVAGIFKAGVWVGVIGVVLIIGVVMFLLSRLQR